MLMRVSRAIARRGVSENQDFVSWSVVSMWLAAAAYLFATFDIFAKF